MNALLQIGIAFAIVWATGVISGLLVSAYFALIGKPLVQPIRPIDLPSRDSDGSRRDNAEGLGGINKNTCVSHKERI
jgi:hypothetical protein